MMASLMKTRKDVSYFAESTITSSYYLNVESSHFVVSFQAHPMHPCPAPQRHLHCACLHKSLISHKTSISWNYNNGILSVVDIALYFYIFLYLHLNATSQNTINTTIIIYLYIIIIIIISLSKHLKGRSGPRVGKVFDSERSGPRIRNVFPSEGRSGSRVRNVFHSELLLSATLPSNVTLF